MSVLAMGAVVGLFLNPVTTSCLLSFSLFVCVIYFAVLINQSVMSCACSAPLSNLAEKLMGQV